MFVRGNVLFRRERERRYKWDLLCTRTVVVYCSMCVGIDCQGNCSW